MSNSNLAKTAVCLVTLLLAAAFASVAFADTPPAEVQSAAEEGLAHFFSTIPAEELALLGFETSQDVEAATLGAPLEQFTLTSDALTAYASGDALAPLLTSTNSWLFPILVNGEARSVLTVSKIDGQWQGGDIGGAPLAAALQAAETELPAMLQQARAASASTTRFIRIFPIRADFLYVQAGEAEYLMPLMATGSSFNLEADTLLAPDQVVPQLDAAMGQAAPAEGASTMGGGADAVPAAAQEAKPALAVAESDVAAEEGASGSPLWWGIALVVLILAGMGGAFLLLRRSQA